MDASPYVLTFTIDSDDRLLLTNLIIYIGDENIPSINDVEPQIISQNKLKYSDIQLQINFSGKMLITDTIVADSYAGNQNYGVVIYQSPWSYLEVIELTFSEGICINANDISKVAEKNRAQGMHLHRSLESVFKKIKSPLPH